MSSPYSCTKGLNPASLSYRQSPYRVTPSPAQLGSDGVHQRILAMEKRTKEEKRVVWVDWEMDQLLGIGPGSPRPLTFSR